jgi:hypothetical protein
MKILVFENDYDAVKGSFELLNIIHYDGLLDVSIVSKYQDAGPLQDIIKYDFIFIDIDLAAGSHADGFEIIKNLIASNYPLNKFSILTGHRNIVSRLNSQGINVNIKVVYKPLTYKVLYESLTS